MPKQTLTLISAADFVFETGSVKETGNPSLSLWADFRFRVYLVTLRDNHFLSHRLAIFENQPDAGRYISQQLAVFSRYRRLTEETREKVELRKQLDFSPLRLKEDDQLQFLCLISESTFETYNIR